jgi:hypothetical protein
VVVESVKVEGGVEIGPIKTQETVCDGVTKDDRRWEGAFLVIERVAYSQRLMRYEYRQGKVVKRESFPLEKLGLSQEQATVDGWPWDFPAWPLTQPLELSSN